ncbi:MAG TPA: DNA cytosine methyltransferase, partial [Terracidiphilus sp.]
MPYLRRPRLGLRGSPGQALGERECAGLRLWRAWHALSLHRDRMTYGSLFTGIGGVDLGLDRAGMECRWQVEIDDYCVKVLKKHWPDVKRYGDITKVNG